MKLTKKDVIWNYLGTFMAMGSNFLILPFLINYLDSELLGLWYVFLSVGGIVTLFDFGFGPTLARNIAYSWSGATELIKNDVIFVDITEPNISLLKKVILTCKRVYLIIAGLALLILLSIGTVYIINISKNVEGNIHLIAWVVYSFAVFFNLYFGYYITFLRGVGAIEQINKATVLSRLIQIFLTIILLVLNLNILGVAIAYFVYGLVFRVISTKMFYRYENIGEMLSHDKSIISNNEIKEIFQIIWHNAWKDGVVSISKYLSGQASVVIASLYLSLTNTGYYSVSIQLVTAVSAISGALYTAYQPSLQAAYIKNDIESLKRKMSTAITLFITLFWLGIIILIFVGLPFISLIKTDFKIDIPVLLCIAIYDFLLKHHSYFASYISNTNKVPYMVPFVLSSFVGIVLSIIFMSFTKIGVWALILSQILSQAFYNNWKWPLEVLKSLNMKYSGMTKIGILEIKNILINNVFNMSSNKTKS